MKPVHSYATAVFDSETKSLAAKLMDVIKAETEHLPMVDEQVVVYTALANVAYVEGVTAPLRKVLVAWLERGWSP